MARVIPFPFKYRHDFVHRQARYMATIRPAAAEQHLQRQLKTQRETLAKKGVDQDLIEHEMRWLEGAIRGALWYAVITPDGGGAA
jgi:hypothetical protein